MPTSRKRWQELTRILNGMEWVKVEPQNARGDVLDVIENEDARDLEDDDAPAADADVRLLRVAKEMVALVDAACDKAVRRVTEHTNGVLESTVKVNKVLADQLASTMKLYDAKLRALDALTDATPGEDGEGLMSSDFIKNLPAMVQAFNAIKALPPGDGSEGGNGVTS